MSESHLRSRFREETRLSIGRYLRETRLRRAANWIKEEGLSVKCVSERAGYPDIHTFSRSFSRVFGHPPFNDAVKVLCFLQHSISHTKMTGGDPVARHDNHDEILKCANAWT
jgi:AraC-like DNA-binding protein